MGNQYGKRWVKTQVALAYKVEKAKEKARLQAFQEFEKRKDLTVEAKEILRNWVKKIDPLEAIAVVGGAIVVHDVIFPSAEFIEKVVNFSNIFTAAPKLFWGFIKGATGFDMGAFQPFFDLPDAQKKEVQSEDIIADITKWIVAFAISYFVMKHGGELLSTAKMFVGGILG